MESVENNYLFDNRTFTNIDFSTWQAVALNRFFRESDFIRFLKKNLIKSLSLKKYSKHTCCRVPRQRNQLDGECFRRRVFQIAILARGEPIQVAGYKPSPTVRQNWSALSLSFSLTGDSHNQLTSLEEEHKKSPLCIICIHSGLLPFLCILKKGYFVISLSLIHI